MSVERAQQLLMVMRDDRLEALYRVMLATGLRRGEALALHWRDVDLDSDSARVRWTLARTSKGPELGEPKTERSRRTVPPPGRPSRRGVHLHTLRNSAASFLLAAGTHTKVVQEHPGHSSCASTADTYSHVAPAQAREAADRLAEAIEC